MGTFVLIHGAGTGGWLWDDVADRLRRRGATVHAPTLSRVGDRVADGGPNTNVTTHVAEVVQLLEFHDIDQAVLVGFSYGGGVIAGAAEAQPDRVRELVFLDAFVPQAGLCLFDLFPPAVRTALEASAEDGWRLHPAPLSVVGEIGATEPHVEEKRVLATLERRGSHPIGTYREALDAPFRRSARIPRRYISCTEKPPADPLVATADALRAAGWSVQDFGHRTLRHAHHA